MCEQLFFFFFFFFCFRIRTGSSWANVDMIVPRYTHRARLSVFSQLGSVREEKKKDRSNKSHTSTYLQRRAFAESYKVHGTTEMQSLDLFPVCSKSLETFQSRSNDQSIDSSQTPFNINSRTLSNTFHLMEREFCLCSNAQKSRPSAKSDDILLVLTFG